MMTKTFKMTDIAPQKMEICSYLYWKKMRQAIIDVSVLRRMTLSEFDEKNRKWGLEID